MFTHDTDQRQIALEWAVVKGILDFMVSFQEEKDKRYISAPRSMYRNVNVNV